MKKTIPILLYCFLFFVHNATAQKIRFTDTSNKWVEMSVFHGLLALPITTSKTSAQKDTFNNLVYTPLLNGEVREDVLNKKVYYKYRLSDTTEYVLYDYTLKVGDTLWQEDTSKLYRFCHVVGFMDSVIINGFWHKLWLLIPTNNYPNGISEYWILEGVGCVSNGLDFPLYPTYFEHTRKLICFSTRGNVVSVYDSATGYTLNAGTCQLSVDNTFKSYKHTTITPNPANEYSTINFPYTIQQGQLLIINSMGQVVADREIHNRQEIRLGSLGTSGLYYYKLIDKHCGNNFSGKFIYQ